MTQGSTIPQQASGTVVDLFKHRQRELFQQVKEKAALCYAIEKITEHCQTEGHVTLEDAEQINYLAHQLRAKLDALVIEIASH